MKVPVISALVILGGCAFSAAKRYPEGVSYDINFMNESSCVPTNIKLEFSGQTSIYWEHKIQSAAILATKAIQSQEFSAACHDLKLTHTNGKSVQEVCREMVCSSEITLSINFYHDANTRAIAYERDGALFINTAKEKEGAGSPGNIAHEVTHILDYKHFSNWAFLGKSSVPYRIGNLVESLVDE
jgi:hypothetical protein